MADSEKKTCHAVVILVLILFVAPCLAQAPAAPNLCYGSTGGFNAAELLTIDFSTGVGTVIGNTGIEGLPGLAIDSSGAIYATSRELADLYRIDAMTGSATLVGPTAIGFLDAIAFDDNDVLYGLGGAGQVSLYTIDTSTGASTLVGGTGEQLAGMAFDPTDGTLYASTGGATVVNPDSVYRVDKTTGALTLVGATSLGGAIQDLCFDAAGTLFGVKRDGSGGPSRLLQIDKTNGAGNWIGTVGINPVSGLASYFLDGDCTADEDCDDRDPCTIDTCDLAACSSVPGGPGDFEQTIYGREYCSGVPSQPCAENVDCPVGQQCLKAVFEWAFVEEFDRVFGSFTTSADIGAYPFTYIPGGTGLYFNDGTVPPGGQSRYYLTRPVCSFAGSWQTTEGTEPGRDLALP